MNDILQGVLLGLILFANILIISIFFRFWGTICNGICSFFKWIFKKITKKER